MAEFTHRTLKIVYSDLAAAVEGLLIVLEDARTTRRLYTITGLSLDQILSNGMTLSGEVDDISSKVGTVQGATLMWQ